jgi:hypothetical protein
VLGGKKEGWGESGLAPVGVTGLFLSLLRLEVSEEWGFLPVISPIL